MSQSESRRVAHCMYVEIELKKKKGKKFFDFESLVLRKFRKITAISHPCTCHDHNTATAATAIHSIIHCLFINKKYITEK